MSIALPDGNAQSKVLKNLKCGRIVSHRYRCTMPPTSVCPLTAEELPVEVVAFPWEHSCRLRALDCADEGLGSALRDLGLYLLVDQVTCGLGSRPEHRSSLLTSPKGLQSKLATAKHRTLQTCPWQQATDEIMLWGSALPVNFPNHCTPPALQVIDVFKHSVP